MNSPEWEAGRGKLSLANRGSPPVSLCVAILARLTHRLVPAALFATGKSLHPTEDLKKKSFFRIQW